MSRAGKKIIILASGSKRRSQILSSCGIRHKVIVSKASEMSGGNLPPKEIVLYNARKKAGKVADGVEAGYIIGADTVVYFEGRLIGKPNNKKAAKTMLSRFSGKRMEVFTGLCLIDASTGKKVEAVDVSTVKVGRIKKRNLDKYFKLLGPYDKAGGFSIEGVGAFLFDDIKGSYFNILGLPVKKLRDLFYRLNLDIFDFVKRR